MIKDIAAAVENIVVSSKEENMKAVVYPLVIGSDWIDPIPPIPLDRASKAAAIKAVRSKGYRVMWRGGMHAQNTVTAEELRRSTGCGTAAIMEIERKIGYALPDSAEIRAYLITVWPKR
jgi:hypothetical protein